MNSGGTQERCFGRQALRSLLPCGSCPKRMVHHENLLTAPRSKCSATPPFPACILLILKQNILATVEDELKSPFETWILPKQHQASFGLISMEDSKRFAKVLKTTLL